MRARDVASGNTTTCATWLTTALLGLWHASGTLACGADATGATDEPTSSVRVVAELADAPEATSPSAERAPNAAEADRSGGGTSPLSQPPPLEPPANPPPLPSSELETTRPITSNEPVDVVVPPGDCRFEYLGEWVRCEHAGWPNVIATDAPDLLSCMRQCLERDDCTAVTDHLWLEQPGLGCALYVSTCDDPAFATAWGEEDGGRDFRRVCSDRTREPIE